MLISDFICIFWATLNHPTMRMLLHCVHRIHCVWHRSLRGNTACAHPMRSIIATCLLFRYWIPWPNNGLHLSLAMQCCPKHAVHAMSHGAAGRFCTRCTSLPHGPQQGCASEEFQQQYSDMLRVMDKLQVACPSQCKAGSSECGGGRSRRPPSESQAARGASPPQCSLGVPCCGCRVTGLPWA